MTLHELKSYPSQFEAIIRRDKTHEFRKNDRGFETDDWLYLREWHPVEENYTGNAALVMVNHITEDHFDVPEGYCVMSIELVCVHRAVEGVVPEDE